MTQEELNARMIAVLEQNLEYNRRLVEAVEKLASDRTLSILAASLMLGGKTTYGPRLQEITDPVIFSWTD